jgi:hypothetical protein
MGVVALLGLAHETEASPGTEAFPEDQGSTVGTAC